jgi:hypothetical protein
MNTPNDPKGAAGALKTPLGLIPPYAMEQTAWVHKLGSDKYGPYNWRKTGVCASTYVNAILRHLNAWRDGETLDPESGISHLAHVACSCNILLDAGFCNTLQDDRNVTPSNTPVSRMDKPTPIKYTVHRTEYRILEVGELIQEGDEFYAESVDMWFPTNIGNMLIRNNDANVYRRKVEPVEIPDEEPEQPVETEYRFLKEGEIVQEGDEYYTNHWWYPTTYSSYQECTASTSNAYRRKVEPEQTVETEYRFLKMGELIQKGDERYGDGKWHTTNYSPAWKSTAAASNVYRRKVEGKQECTCGRIKINHHTLGWICEDCEWHGEPY